MVDIARDPRWGRIAEGAGEDPVLGSAMAAAYVRGYQGTELSAPSSIAACVKHYVGYGAAEGGRDYDAVDMSESRLREIYFPPFKAASEAGAATFMSSFNTLNGVPATANRFTLRQVLKGEWGFRGFVVSDWYLGYVADLVRNGGVPMSVVDDAVRRILLVKNPTWSVRAPLCKRAARSRRAADRREPCRRAGDRAEVNRAAAQ